MKNLLPYKDNAFNFHKDVIRRKKNPPTDPTFKIRVTSYNNIIENKFEEFENKLYYAPAPSSFLNNTTNSENLKSNQIDYNQIFTDEIPVDNPPDFEGGMIGFINKINEVVDTSNFMGNEGFLKTILSFTVNTDGTISDCKFQ